MSLKVKQRIKKALPTIYKWLAIILTIGIAFVYGTFKPNWYTENKIIKKTESQIVETAHSFGLHEPEFVYNNDETFIGAVTMYQCTIRISTVNKCISIFI